VRASRVKLLVITLLVVGAFASAWKITSQNSPSGAPFQTPAATPMPVPTLRESVPPEVAPQPRIEQEITSNPVRVIIESVGISSDLMELGLNPDGTLEVPPDSSISGWYIGGPKPGEMGPAVIASHVSWNGVKGPFFTLDEVKAGDLITVIYSDDSRFQFEVISTASYEKEKFPTGLVYGNLNYQGLHLITCDSYDNTTKQYAKNLVVYAKLVL
jgi:hypothetical protein